MGVTMLLVIVACIYVVQGSLQSNMERQKISAIAKMLRRKVVGEKLSRRQSVIPTTWTPTPTTWTPSPTTWTPSPNTRTPTPATWAPSMPTSYPTNYPTMNPTTPDQIDFYQHWVDCPVMETILQQYFWGFPDTTMPIDYMRISLGEIEPVLKRAITTFNYLKNVRVTIDQLTEDMARLLLKKRVQCTATMYQRVFVYYMRRQLDKMMSPYDSSLKSRIQRVLTQYFPNNLGILNQLDDIVRGIHYIIHESFIGMVQQEEFRSLGWFLRDYKWDVTSVLERFHRGEFSSVDDVTTHMKNDFYRYEMNYPDAFRCTTPQELIRMHRRAVNMTSSGYLEARRSGVAVAFLTQLIQEQFSRSPTPTSGVPLDPTVVDMAIQSMVHEIFDYVNGTMAEFAMYEQYLATATLSPPTFMASSLDGAQWNMTLVLFNRMFGGNTTGPTGGPLTVQDIVMFLRKDVENLKKIQNMIPTYCSGGYSMMNPILASMIQEKESVINGSQAHGAYRYGGGYGGY